MFYHPKRIRRRSEQKLKEKCTDQLIIHQHAAQFGSYALNESLHNDTVLHSERSKRNDEFEQQQQREQRTHNGILNSFAHTDEYGNQKSCERNE